MPWLCGNCNRWNCEGSELMCKDQIAQLLYDHFNIPYAIGWAIGQASFYGNPCFATTTEHDERVYRHAGNRV